jgi:hypothetical protein
MNFTFGIITDGNNNGRIGDICCSIMEQGIPNHEIIVVGPSHTIELRFPGFRHIEFDEGQKRSWITRKKNLITKHAKFDNIVYMHDYISLAPGWYEDMKEFGEDWDICMNRMLNPNGSRYRDWCSWDDPQFGRIVDCPEDWAKKIGAKMGGSALVPYDYPHSKYMYISGAFWIAKKHVMMAEPLNEELCWGEGEDVEWSMRVREKYNYVLNKKASVRLLKSKHPIFREVSEFK